MHKTQQTFIPDLYHCLDVLAMNSATRTEQLRLVSDEKYATKTNSFSNERVRVFSKVLICRPETEALIFDRILSEILDIYTTWGCYTGNPQISCQPQGGARGTYTVV